MQNHTANRRTSTQTLPSENCTVRLDPYGEVTAIYQLQRLMTRLRPVLARNPKKKPGSPSDVHRHILDVSRAVLGLDSGGGLEEASPKDSCRGAKRDRDCVLLTGII